MPLFCARQYKHVQKNSQTLCMKIIKSNERFYLFADKLEGSGTKSLNSQSRDKSRRNSFENRTSRGTESLEVFDSGAFLYIYFCSKLVHKGQGQNSNLKLGRGLLIDPFSADNWGYST